MENRLGIYSLINVGHEDIEDIFPIYLSNEEYFIISGGVIATKENIINDMNEMPPDIRKEQKNYRAIKLGDKIIGIIDYITEFPDEDAIYIGLYMIDKSLQGKSYGQNFLKYFEEHIKEQGFNRIRLGVLHNNPLALRFWERNEFNFIKEVKSTIHPDKEWIIKVMEKRI